MDGILSEKFFIETMLKWVSKYTLADPGGPPQQLLCDTLTHYVLVKNECVAGGAEIKADHNK